MRSTFSFGTLFRTTMVLGAVATATAGVDGGSLVMQSLVPVPTRQVTLENRDIYAFARKGDVHPSRSLA